MASGPDDAPPVVPIHGSQANSASWMPDVALWSPKFRLFTVDMIGEAGLSARVRSDLIGDAHALWLDDVFKGLELRSAGIVGTSLGGWLALYASRRPAAVQALAVVERAKAEGLPLEPFTVHDLRRTGSTLLNELGFNSDWIEKCLAHEDGRSSRGVYNKAEYEVQRRHMMQEWSDIVDAWVDAKKYAPTLIPPSMPILEPDPAL